jgi:TetR/AcrR family transcriptional regulator
MHPGSQAGSSSSPRVLRRRAEARRRILAAAAGRFAAAGPDAVRLDEVAETADVARGTLYSHFRTKDELLSAIVRPVLERAVRQASGLARLDARRGVEGLLGVYLDLWRDYPDALRIAYKAQDLPIGADVLALHRRFLKGVMRVFDRAARAGVLRSGDAVLAAHVLRQVAVPLLELYAESPRWDALFVESVEGLLLKPATRQPT